MRRRVVKRREPDCTYGALRQLQLQRARLIVARKVSVIAMCRVVKIVSVYFESCICTSTPQPSLLHANPFATGLRALLVPVAAVSALRCGGALHLLLLRVYNLFGARRVYMFA